MKKLIYLIPIILLTACYTEHKAIEKFGCHIKDSVHYDTIVKEKLIIKTIKADTVKVTVQSPCDSTGKLKTFKKEVKSSTGKTTGILFSDTTTNTIEADCFEQEYKDSFIYSDSLVRVYRQIAATNPEVKISEWQKFVNTTKDVLAFMGIISLLCIILFIVVKAIK